MTKTLLINIQQQIGRIGDPICIFIGDIGGAIDLFVFLQKTMRRNPCGLFLIAYMITNMLYINFTILVAALDSLFQTNSTIQSPIFCRIYYYLSFVLAVIPPYLLSMASLDRTLASSHNVHTRLRRIPATFITYYNLICVGIVPLSLMISFGIRVLININRIRVIRNPLNNNRHLIILLIVQVTVYLCLHLLSSLFLMDKEITKFNSKTSDRIIIEQFIQGVVYFSQFIQISFSPLLNLTSKTFRKELKQAWDKIMRKVNQPSTIERT